MVLMYSLSLIAAFEDDRPLTIGVTLGVISCFGYIMKAHRLRIEERLLNEMKQTSQS